MLNNSSRFAMKNQSYTNFMGQSQLPIQTYGLKLQNNKPVKLFIKIRNEKTNSQTFSNVITMVTKISQILFRYKKEIFAQWKDMMEEVEQQFCNGPSLLEQMMQSEIPVRNGSFLNTGMAFSVLQQNMDLNKSMQSRRESYRGSINNKFIPGLLKLMQVVQNKNKQCLRLFFDNLKDQTTQNTKQLMSKVIKKIALFSTLNIETSILRLKNFCRMNPIQQKQKQKQQQTPKLEQQQKSKSQEKIPMEQIPNNQQQTTISDLKPIKSLAQKQNLKRIQCFITIIQNIDKLKTFDIISDAFSLLKVC